MSFFRRTFFISFLVLSTLVVLEGVASWGLFAGRVFGNGAPESAERLHTEHDSELGWINQPRVQIPNLYGPGIPFSTNTLRMRASSLPSKSAEKGTRIICSGDSFTLGYGVADEETWCHLLAEMTKSTTYNMGQGGYGLDQIYLWYKRDGQALVPHLHIVAITLQDIVRMQYSSFLGYSKPKLSFQEGTLHRIGVPVPKPSRLVRPIWALQQATLGLRLSKVLGNDESAQVFIPPSYDQVSEHTLMTTQALFRELKESNESLQIQTKVVLLPIKEDLSDPSAQKLIDYLTGTLTQLSIPYLDLISAMRSRRKSEILTFFIPEGILDYPGAAGHYTAAGNGWVAGQVAPALPIEGMAPVAH